MNTPELTLNETIAMLEDKTKTFDPTQTYHRSMTGIMLHALHYLSLARLQIESQGVTWKPEGSSSAFPASSDTGGADVVPVSEYVDIEVVSGVEGSSLCINEKRICGPKPWGGGKVIHSWRAQVQWIREAVERKLPAPPIHTEESPSDTRLIDWLEESGEWLCSIGNDYGEDETEWKVSRWLAADTVVSGQSKSLRSAIKAAMEQEK